MQPATRRYRNILFPYIFENKYGRLNNSVPKVPTAWSLAPLFDALHGGRGSEQRRLRWAHYPGLARWVLGNDKGSYTVETRLGLEKRR